MKRTLMGAMLLVACMGIAGSAAADGATLYNKSRCTACHGAGGAGTAMGPALDGNEFVASSHDEEVAKVIVNGRNGAERRHKSFAMGMPGNRKLSDEDLGVLVEYVKSLASR